MSKGKEVTKRNAVMGQYILKKLTESIRNNLVFGEPKPANAFKLVQSKMAVLGAVEQNYGIYQIPSFRDEVTTLWNDPLLREAVTMFAEQVVATGAFLTYNSKYILKIKGETAIEVIKHWYDLNNIDGKLLEIAIEMKAFGNSFWRITDDGFVKTPIESVWHAVRIAPDVPLQVRYHMQLVPIYGGGVMPWGSFIHFRTGVTGYRAPMGQGVIFSLLARPVDSEGNIAPSIYDIRLSMRASLHEGFKKFSFGNELWSLEGMSNEDFNAALDDGKSIADHISDMSSTGNRIVTNTKGTIQLAVPQRTESYDKFIKQMNDEFLMSLADPSLKLGLEQGFTKATSVTASETYKYKVATMRKAIKEHFEDLFKQILDNLGYDGTEAGVQMNFGPEEVAVYDIADIFAAVNGPRPIITPDEARVLLSKYHKWDVEGTIKYGDQVLPPGVSKGDGSFGGAKNAPRSTSETLMKKQEESVGTAEIVPVPSQELAFPNPQVIVTPLADALARFSGDLSKVYIDPLVPEYRHRAIVKREVFQWQLEFKTGFSYDAAEQLADTFEMAEVVSEGYSWEKCQADDKAALALILARTEKVKNPEDTVTHQ